MLIIQLWLKNYYSLKKVKFHIEKSQYYRDMKLTVTVILFFCSVSLIGQKKYIPFPASNTYWVVHQFDEFNNLTDGWNWYIIGDTVINSFNYHIYAVDYDTSFSVFPPLIRMYGIRNDTINKKVFVYEFNGKFEKLLYDFSLSIGDTIPDSYNGTSRYKGRIITKIDTIIIDNNKHLVFEVDSNQVSPYIEGIGSTSGPIFEDIIWFEGGFELMCTMAGVNRTPYFNRFPSECKLATGIAVQNDINDKILLYPNPSSGTFKIQLKGVTNGEIEVYNTHGSLVFQQIIAKVNSIEINLPQSLENGIYLVQFISYDVRASQRLSLKRK